MIPILWLGLVSYPGGAILRTSKEDLLGITLAVRGGRYPFPDDQKRPLLGAFWSDPVYCPDLVHAPQVADIERLIAKARSENRPLYIEFGHRELARAHHPDSVRRLEGGADFELVRVFRGLEEAQFTHYLFRLKAE